MRIVPVFGGPPTPPVLWCIVGSIIIIEIILQLSDYELFGTSDLRIRLISLGAFWDSLFPPSFIKGAIYPAQPYAMFLSHVFLHGGMVHAIMNSVILISLSKTLAAYNSVSFVLISMIIGAIFSSTSFGLLADTSAPMIGASGMVFALIGLWLRQSRSQELSNDAFNLSIVTIFATLVVIHLILHVFMGGQSAWQAHLGGFVAGYFVIPWFAGLGLLKH